MNVADTVIGAVAGGALVAAALYVRDWRRARKLRATIAAMGLRAASPHELEPGAPVPAEQLTVIPDRYCQRCNEPRGGPVCPLCSRRTITIPPDVLAEEIEAHRPKGQEP